MIDDKLGTMVFEFRLWELELLENCVLSSDSFSEAMILFLAQLGRSVAVEELVYHWLRFAEKIKTDPTFLKVFVDGQHTIVHTPSVA